MLRVQRKVLRAGITKNYNEYINGVIDVTEAVSKIEDKYSRLCDVDNKILKEMEMDKSYDEETWEKELILIEEYREKVEEIKKNSQTVPVQQMEASQIKKKSINLPTIKLSTFDGNIENWNNFYQQFKKIHNDEELENEVKFHYLFQSLEGNARKFIQNYQFTADNYERAFADLQNRFAKTELLINFYVRNLMNIMVNQLQERSFTLSELYDQIIAQINNLYTININVNDFSLFLVPILESCLPQEISKLWERKKHDQANVNKSNFSNFSINNSIQSFTVDDLLSFVKNEVETEEKLKFVNRSIGHLEKTFTAADLISTQIQKPVNQPPVSKQQNKQELGKCIFCAKSHNAQDCIYAQSLTLENKQKLIKEKRACMICFKIGHYSKFCKSFVKCIICKKRHYAIMCSELVSNKSKDKGQGEVVETKNLICNESNTVLLQTVRAFVIIGNIKYLARILFDSGSQFSYILKSTAEKLKLPVKGYYNIVHGLFGGVSTKPVNHTQYIATIKSVDEKFQQEFILLGQEKICGSIPKIPAHKYKELQKRGIELSDTINGPTEIDILLGGDSLPHILSKNLKTHKIDDDCIAIQSPLGWSLLGKCASFINIAENCASLNCISEFWSLETIGIRENCEVQSEKEKELIMEESFKKDITRDIEDRYEVRLPFKSDLIKPANNKEETLKRVKCVKRKLESANKYEEYDNVLKDWLKKGIIEIVEYEENEKFYYLPHRPVFREKSSTSKVRPVFDGSAKTKNGLSLNDCLFKGPNLIEDLVQTLIKWRLKKFALTADIQQAFLAIGIAQEDRDVLRFIWFDDNGNNIELRHRRLVFGLICSPFILKTVLNSHFTSDTTFAKTRKLVQNSFYCDNLLISANSCDELVKFVYEILEIMSTSKFILREWCFNKNFVHNIDDLVKKKCSDQYSVDMCTNKTVNVLGIKWNTEQDTLFCDISELKLLSVKKLTKRCILSVTQKIYDPLGVLIPVTLYPKIVLQKLWVQGKDWDEEIDVNIQSDFITWMDEFKTINLEVNRWLNWSTDADISFHIFCDASSAAYASCIFIRIKENNNVFINLVIAKARISPIRQVTIPRLELLACLLGVRLFNSVKEALPISEVTFWTDSLVALQWIKGKAKSEIFIRNRVQEILNFTSTKQWRHVKGENNPADSLTRPCNIKKFIESKWWCGPTWLKSENWCNKNEEENIILECTNLINTTLEMLSSLTNYFSKYKKIVRIIAWIQRFIFNSRNTQRKSGEINGDEFIQSEKILLKYVQEQSNISEGNYNFETFTDDHGLIRVKTRIVLGDFTEQFKTPILLPNNNRVVELLVTEYHLKSQHTGLNALRCILRENFFILKGKQLIKRIIANCITCKRFNAKRITVPSAPLPAPRVNLVPVFSVTGIDCAGPFFLRNGTKAWMTIFTCAVYRSIHLELMESMSTDAFILALRRFIARRTRCRIIYSDNGTNFRGCYNNLNSIDWNKVMSEGVEPIEWRFNPPAAPWWGGFYERMIGVVKDLLRKVLGHSSLTYEELYTVMVTCESVVNERPLTYVYSDSDELQPITPSMFLREVGNINETIDLDIVDENSLRSKLKYLQHLRSQLKERFRKEYLSELIQFKNNKNKQMNVGDIVLVEVENKKRINWPLGIITKIIKGADNNERVAKVKIGDSTIVRPFQRLFSLEMTDEYMQSQTQKITSPVQEGNQSIISDEVLNEDRPAEAIQTSRRGRIIRPIERLNL